MSPEELAEQEAREAEYKVMLAAARPSLKANWVEHNNNNNNNNNYNNNSNSNNINYNNNSNSSNYEKKEDKRLLKWWTIQNGEEKAEKYMAAWKKSRKNFRKSLRKRMFRKEFGLPDPKKKNLRQVGRQLGHRQLLNNATRNELRERQRIYGWRASRRLTRKNRKTRRNRRS